MCGLCGMLSYSDQPVSDLYDLIHSLMESSASRGTDAAGIAFCADGKLNIWKEGKSAYRISFKPPENIRAFMGHTRHSTQGSEKRNRNNHPFYGKVKNGCFALAHNGVLTNERELRRMYQLPKTKIETDSFAAVQLLEKLGTLNHKSMKEMAEAVEGSYSFSILDSKGTLSLIRGDSPLVLLHFPDLKRYVYASTEEILWRALIETEMFEWLKAGMYEEIAISSGEILSITEKGVLTQSKFHYKEVAYSYFCDWRNYEISSETNGFQEDSYLSALREIAPMIGSSSEKVDELASAGFSCEEIEEYIYGIGG